MEYVYVTNHAFERFMERVRDKREGELDFPHKVRKWFDEAVKTGKVVKEKDGKQEIAYEGFAVVYEVETNSAITVRPYNPALDENSVCFELGKEINEVVQRHILKELQPLKKQLKDKKIEYHQEEIKWLRVNVPKTRRIIRERIEEIKEEIKDLEKKVDGIHYIAKRYEIEL